MPGNLIQNHGLYSHKSINRFSLKLNFIRRIRIFYTLLAVFANTYRNWIKLSFYFNDQFLIDSNEFIYRIKNRKKVIKQTVSFFEFYKIADIVTVANLYQESFTFSLESGIELFRQVRFKLDLTIQERLWLHELEFTKPKFKCEK